MKILNFGSLNMDKVYHVNHFVCPGETLASSKFDTFCGGKGLNQSIAIANAGMPVYHAGLVGNDGKVLVDCLKRYNVNTDYVQMINGATGHAIIQIDITGQNAIILYGGVNQVINLQYVDDVLSHFKKDDFLLVQNEINNVPYIIEKAYEIGMKVVFNPAPMDETVKGYPLDKVSTLVVNSTEGRMLSGFSEPSDILKALSKRYSSAVIVLTLGAKGVICSANGKYYSHEAYKVPVVDTTAAGDTFIGFFVSEYAQGKDMESVLKMACLASALAVSKEGAAPSIPHINDVITVNENPSQLSLTFKI